MTTDRTDGSTELEGEGPVKPKGKHHLPLWQETILLLVVALGLAILIKAVLLQAFYIPSESMEPGLVRNDRILVQKVSYWFGGSPERGDVVVFKDPGGWLPPQDAAGPTGTVARADGKGRPLPLGRPPGEAGHRRGRRQDPLLRRPGPHRGQRRAARRGRLRHQGWRRPASAR